MSGNTSPASSQAPSRTIKRNLINSGNFNNNRNLLESSDLYFGYVDEGIPVKKRTISMDITNQPKPFEKPSKKLTKLEPIAMLLKTPL